MLVEKIKKIRNNPELKYSCSETILYAANEEYNLNLDDNTFKTMAPFSGGMMIEDTCGAVAGALAVLGILFTQNIAAESKLLKKLTVEFLEEYKQRMKSIKCDSLKVIHRTEKEGCNNVILVAGEILDNIIKKEKGK